MSPFLTRWLGAAPPRQPPSHIVLAGIGSMVALGVIAGLAQLTPLPWILGSFGASCVLIFGFPEAPFSQPRAVIGGHVVASLIGVATVSLLGSTWYAVALAGGLAIMAMMCLRIVHPPAGSNPVIAVVGAASWDFVLTPTLIGAVALVLMGQIYRIYRMRSVPHP